MDEALQFATTFSCGCIIADLHEVEIGHTGTKKGVGDGLSESFCSGDAVPFSVRCTQRRSCSEKKYCSATLYFFNQIRV